MIEIPLVGLLMLITLAAFLGFMSGRLVELATSDGRKRRALAKVPATWEVHVGGDGRDYGYGVIGTGDHVVVTVRKVRRSGRHFQLLQKIEVARVRGESDPEKILTAVDRAQVMVSTLALTGAA